MAKKPTGLPPITQAPPMPPIKPAKGSRKKTAPKPSATVHIMSKEAATMKGEPWVAVLNFEIDTKNPEQGAFELDWNDIFVARLVKAGYVGKNDQAIVDMWFKAVCRNVVLETYEQDQADPSNRTPTSRKKDLGDGRSEIS